MNAWSWLLLALLCLLSPVAMAVDPCPELRQQVQSPDRATRIAAVACTENLAWFRPFIDADGHSSGQPVYEAENDALADGTTAWKKVARYWTGSGLGGTCNNEGAACRNFVIDAPWSAAFVSWVMRRAGVRGFNASARHVDYVRAALRDGTHGPYRLLAPDSTAPGTGDMLCYVRAGTRVLGHDGLLDRLQQGDGLPMHCDIVVAAEAGGLAWLIGGNVQQAVTLRMLRLDADGRLADLPRRHATDSKCSPDMPEQCNLNRQDWVALLKLQDTAGITRDARVARRDR